VIFDLLKEVSCVQKVYRAYVEALIGQENLKKLGKTAKKNI
jgi:hypothetical protein